MNKIKNIPYFLIVILFCFAIALVSCNPVNTSPTTPPATSPDISSDIQDGNTLMEERCTKCHTTGRITSKSATLEEWTITVDRMIGKGAQLDSAEKETLLQYLAQTYP